MVFDHHTRAAHRDMVAFAFGASLQRGAASGARQEFKEIAEHYGGATGGGGRSGAAAKAMGSEEFRQLIAESAELAANERFVERALHRQFSRVIEVSGFDTDQIPSLGEEFDGTIFPAISEGGEIKQSMVSFVGGTRTARMASYGKIVGIRRSEIVSSVVEPFSMRVASLASSAARTEAKLVVAALEENGSLDDGALVFHEQFGNMISEPATAFAAETFDAGIRAMRNHKPDGKDAADLLPRWILVPPDGEAAAHHFVQQYGFAGKIDVLGMADLPARRWYLLADPDVAPVVGVLKLRDIANAVQVRVRRNVSTFDGIAVRVLANLGAAILGRAGVVRGGA